MNELCRQLLARIGLAGEQDIGVRAGNALKPRAQPFDCRTHAD